MATHRKPPAADSALPLFIPLRTEWFLKFRVGSKDTEYRPYGPRWNERTCWTGRPVTLSCGYGKRERLTGRIKSFSVLDAAPDPAEWGSVYGDKECKIAAITITDIDEPNVRDQVSPLASGATSCVSRNRDRSAEGMGINCIALLALFYFFLNPISCVFAGNACVGGNMSNSKHDRNVSVGSLKMKVAFASSLDELGLDGVHVSPYLQSGFNRGLPHFCIERPLPTNLGKNRCDQCGSGSARKSGDEDGNKLFHILVISVVLGGFGGVLGCPIGVWVARYFLANTTIRDGGNAAPYSK